MRIVDHPILGRRRKRKTVRINFNGRPIDALKGEPIAAALIASGMRAFRRTKRFHHPRGVFCALGRCTDCVMVVDGVPNVRTCVTPVTDGMDVRTLEEPGSWKYDERE
jgi:aerobic-type carbon monoxide dehydrogenase small subunit (CoxS/CutS family)